MTIYRYEKDLVEDFIKNDKGVFIKEFSIRWGNIDIVSIKGLKKVPFNKEQIELLSIPSYAKIYTKLNNNRPIKKETLFKGLGISESTFNGNMSKLNSNGLILKKGNKYLRGIKYKLPNITIYGYEAKLTNFKKVFSQALGNFRFVNYNYIVMPQTAAAGVYKHSSDKLKEYNIGLIGVSEGKSNILIKAPKIKNIKPHNKLMSIMKYKGGQLK